MLKKNSKPCLGLLKHLQTNTNQNLISYKTNTSKTHMTKFDKRKENIEHKGFFQDLPKLNLNYVFKALVARNSLHYSHICTSLRVIILS